MKLNRYSNNVYQILDGSKEIVGFALRLSNGHWGAFSKDDIRLTRAQFKSPSEVRDFIAGRDALAKEAQR